MAPWEGSFNSTQMAVTSSDDGMTAECKADKKCVKGYYGCKTNILMQNNLTRASNMCSWLSSSCTSCNQGYAFLMLCHKSKTGRCLQPKPELNILCGTLDEDKSTYNLGSSTVCTKSQIVMSRVNPIRMFPKGSLERRLLKPAEGHHKHSVAKCRLWKQTVCRSGSCRVKKEVECLEVCKMKSYPNVPDEDTCDSEYCINTTGAALCKHVAMMA